MLAVSMVRESEEGNRDSLAGLHNLVTTEIQPGHKPNDWTVVNLEKLVGLLPQKIEAGDRAAMKYSGRWR